MSKKIEPTEAMVGGVELGRKLMQMDVRAILRAALNHPDARGLFADEDTIRAAREQGWDQATLWIDSYQGGPNGRTDSARSANPYRPAQELPSENGAVIVPAGGHEFIETSLGLCHYVMIHAGDGRWRGGAGVIASEDITPGTWKVEGE